MPKATLCLASARQAGHHVWPQPGPPETIGHAKRKYGHQRRHQYWRAIKKLLRECSAQNSLELYMVQSDIGHPSVEVSYTCDPALKSPASMTQPRHLVHLWPESKSPIYVTQRRSLLYACDLASKSCICDTASNSPLPVTQRWSLRYPWSGLEISCFCDLASKSPTTLRPKAQTWKILSRRKFAFRLSLFSWPYSLKTYTDDK